MAILERLCLDIRNALRLDIDCHIHSQSQIATLRQVK